MKSLVSFVIAIMLLVISVSCSSEHYVSTQPEAVVVTRPAAPHPHYVWVDGDYMWSGGKYVYHQGYWAAPKLSRVWVSGAWVSTPRGFYWRRGYWK